MNDNAPLTAPPMLTPSRSPSRRRQAAAPTPSRQPWLNAGNIAWLAVWLVPAVIGIAVILYQP